MTLDEIVDYLQVKKSTIYDWVYKREIPHIKVGSHLRFDPKEVLKYFREMTGQRQERYMTKAVKEKLTQLSTSCTTMDELMEYLPDYEKSTIINYFIKLKLKLKLPDSKEIEESVPSSREKPIPTRFEPPVEPPKPPVVVVTPPIVEPEPLPETQEPAPKISEPTPMVVKLETIKVKRPVGRPRTKPIETKQKRPPGRSRIDGRSVSRKATNPEWGHSGGVRRGNWKRTQLDEKLIAEGRGNKWGRPVCSGCGEEFLPQTPTETRCEQCLNI